MASYTTYNDELLVQLLQSDDEKAFREIYERYWKRLLYVAGKKLKDIALAEELVQDVFLDIWKRRSSLIITGELQAYLSVAMKYKVIKAQARLQRAEDYKLFAAHNLSQSASSTEEYLDFEELKDRLQQLVADLPEKCRLAYKLREEGLSQREIAQQMKISESTVESHIVKALKSLRSGLTQLFFFFF